MRVVLVSRRFWPLVGGAESHMLYLAEELRRQGAEVTVLTGRQARSFPARLTVCEVPGWRLKHPRRRIWGTYRWTQALSHWLRGHADTYDVVYVSLLKHEAYAAVGAMRRVGKPIVLRAEGAGPGGDCHWLKTSLFGPRICKRLLAADAVVACNEGIAEELAATGFCERQIVRIHNGVPMPPPRDDAYRQDARQALARLDQRLIVENGERVAVYAGRLARGKGLETLIRAWRNVTRERPNCILWLVGDGPLRGRLVDLIHTCELRTKVVLAGRFSTAADLLAAADLFVLPTEAEAMSLAALEAMATPLPVILSDIAANSALIQPEKNGLLAPVGDAGAWAEAILRLLDNETKSRRLALRARETVAERFSIEHTAGAHRALFSRL